jgi:glycosyltransferase involved in cell wall biosynthesis
MFSIVVCTCNRAEKLANLLDSLARMRVPDGVQWEVVVVDNNSTDGTARLLREFAAEGAIPLRHSFESQQGLAVAHNHALDAARGDVIIFTDDDCRVAEDWLAVIAHEFDSDPELCMLGGRVELFNPADRAITVRRGRERIDLTGDNRALDVLIGCNLAFRRALTETLGRFDTRFGVGGSTVPSCDDVDFTYRIIRAGARAVYSPEMVVLHDHGRATDEQVTTLQLRYLQGRGGFYAKYVLQGDRNMQRLAYWEFRKLVAGIVWSSERGANLTALRFLLKGAGRFFRGRRAGSEWPTSART